jgi:hypothetical protein
VVPWIDSGQPAGQRWAQLAATEQNLWVRLGEERRLAETRLSWDDLMHLPGSEPDPSYGLGREQIEAMTTPRTTTNAEVATRNKRYRAGIEKASSQGR